jgi:predicted homoserine dehydrogenase-like protein
VAIAGRATVVLAPRASRVVGNVEGLQGGGIPAMLTSFTDDTKVSCGQAIVANATGFRANFASLEDRGNVCAGAGKDLPRSNTLSTYVAT